MVICFGGRRPKLAPVTPDGEGEKLVEVHELPPPDLNSPPARPDSFSRPCHAWCALFQDEYCISVRLNYKDDHFQLTSSNNIHC